MIFSICVLLFVSASIFIGYYCFLLRFKLGSPHRSFILAFLFSFGQIILTQLLLGIAGELYLPVLILLNMVLALFFFFSGWREVSAVALRQELSMIAKGVRNALSLENVLLGILFAFVMVWVAAAIYFFAPRNGDELWYHLPPVYEYVLDHKIFLLPLEFNLRYAFPENAELLFMWPAIFLHSQLFIQSVQIVVLLWGMVIVYGLARMLEIKQPLSLMAGLLFALTPVVMFQLASCYIDIINAVFFLAALYTAGMFHQTCRRAYFYAAALSAGLLWGMKYNELLFVFLLMPFLCKKGAMTLKDWVIFTWIFLMAGSFWYLRNIWFFKTPVYPLPFSLSSLKVYDDNPENFQLVKFISLIPAKLLTLWKDVGLGSLHGGYGLVFWGLALPAWAYTVWKSIIGRNKFIFWMCLPVVFGIGQLLYISLNSYYWIGRYAIFAVALALVALVYVMMVFERYVYFTNAVKILSLVFAVFAAAHLCNAQDWGPSYGIDVPVKDFLTGRFVSRESYADRRSWGLIDYLTLNDKKGLSYYMEPNDRAELAYIYGTQLQNRVWNFEQDKSLPPDGFVLYGITWPQFVRYFNYKFSPRQALARGDYRFIQQEGKAMVFIRKSFFWDPQKEKLLDNYYKIEGITQPASEGSNGQ